MLLAASSSILVPRAKKRELLPDEGCGVLFLPRTFAKHRSGGALVLISYEYAFLLMRSYSCTAMYTWCFIRYDIESPLNHYQTIVGKCKYCFLKITTIDQVFLYNCMYLFYNGIVDTLYEKSVLSKVKIQIM